MGYLSISTILKLSKLHDKTHAEYEEGHCPICHGKDLDTPDFEGQAKYKIG